MYQLDTRLLEGRRYRNLNITYTICILSISFGPFIAEDARFLGLFFERLKHDTAYLLTPRYRYQIIGRNLAARVCGCVRAYMHKCCLHALHECTNVIIAWRFQYPIALNTALTILFSSLSRFFD